MKIKVKNNSGFSFIPATDLKIAIVNSNLRFITVPDFESKNGKIFLKKVNRRLGTHITSKNLNDEITISNTKYSISEENSRGCYQIEIELTNQNLFTMFLNCFQKKEKFYKEYAVIRINKESYQCSTSKPIF